MCNGYKYIGRNYSYQHRAYAVLYPRKDNFVEVTVLRAGSRGLDGTYENINHHAKKVRSTVKRLVALVKEYEDDIKEWRQAHNVHVIVTKDGRMMSFRPFRRHGGEITGVEVAIRHSRSVELAVMQVENLTDMATFIPFFKTYLNQQPNFYGVSDSVNS